MTYFLHHVYNEYEEFVDVSRFKRYTNASSAAKARQNFMHGYLPIPVSDIGFDCFDLVEDNNQPDIDEDEVINEFMSMSSEEFADEIDKFYQYKTNEENYDPETDKEEFLTQEELGIRDKHKLPNLLEAAVAFRSKANSK